VTFGGQEDHVTFGGQEDHVTFGGQEDHVTSVKVFPARESTNMPGDRGLFSCGQGRATE